MPILHSPLPVRVRVRAVDNAQTYVSPWKYTYLLDPANIYDALWGPRASPNFLDWRDVDGNAPRVVFPHAGPAVFGRDWVNHPTAQYSVEVEVWQNGTWGPQSAQEGSYPITSGADPVLVFTSRSTGTPDTSPSHKTVVPGQARGTIKITAQAQWVVPELAYDTNACHPTPSVYADLSIPQAAELRAELPDTNLPSVWSGPFAPLLDRIFPASTWRPDFDSLLKTGYYGFSRVLYQDFRWDASPPSVGTYTFRVDFRDANGNLPATYTLDNATVTMGRYGELVAFRLVRPDGTTTGFAVPVAQPSRINDNLTVYRYTWTFADEPAKGLEIDVRPSLWKLRDVESWFLWIRTWWGIEWKKGLEIVNIEAWERVPAQNQNWYREAYVPVQAILGMPESASLYPMLQRYDLIPPAEVPLDRVQYRIELINADPSLQLFLSRRLATSDGACLVDFTQLAKPFWKSTL